MAAKFRWIDQQRKNEPLIKDFLHSPLAFDVPCPNMGSLDTRVSRERAGPALLVLDRLQRSSLLVSRSTSIRPGRAVLVAFLLYARSRRSRVHLTLWKDSRSRQVGRSISRSSAGMTSVLFHGFLQFHAQEVWASCFARLRKRMAFN